MSNKEDTSHKIVVQRTLLSTQFSVRSYLQKSTGCRQEYRKYAKSTTEFSGELVPADAGSQVRD